MTDKSSGSGKKRAEDARPTRAAPKAREAVLDQATCEEPAQHALDDGAERAVLLGEALRVYPQELLEVLLDQPEERGLPRPTRPVHPRTDLHAIPTAGGRDRREPTNTCPVYGREKSLGPAGVNTGPHERRSVKVSGPATLAVIRLGEPTAKPSYSRGPRVRQERSQG